jgi:hypothetical protein
MHHSPGLEESKATHITSPQVSNSQKIIVEFEDSVGSIEDYFGFPITSLEALANFDEKKYATRDVLPECA